MLLQRKSPRTPNLKCEENSRKECENELEEQKRQM
jgi:hypothetical protein